jgi:hypothetical protein
MRKSIFALVTALAVLAAGGVAYAANVYSVTGNATPAGKGTAKKPVPKTLKFGLAVADSNPANRGTPIKTFAIGAEGLVTYPEAFPTCSFSQANSEKVSGKCKKAKVGTGLVQNIVGPGTSPTTKLFCNLKLALYNISGSGKNGGLAIRLDGDPPSPTSESSKAIGCPTPIHLAIKSAYKPVKIGGVTSDELRFTVPPDLLHPSGLDNTVRNVTAKIAKTAKKKIAGKSRKVGFYSGVGCKGKTRDIRATFTAEDGVKGTDTSTFKC